MSSMVHRFVLDSFAQTSSQKDTWGIIQLSIRSDSRGQPSKVQATTSSKRLGQWDQTKFHQLGYDASSSPLIPDGGDSAPWDLLHFLDSRRNTYSITLFFLMCHLYLSLPNFMKPQ